MNVFVPALVAYVPLILIAQFLAGLLQAPATPKHAIWWNPKLQLASLSAIPQRLRQPFEDSISVRRNDQRGTISNCEDYFKYSELGYEPSSDRELRVLRSAGIECLAIRSLEGATVAQTSYLPNLHLDTKSPRYLPAILALAISDEEKERVQAAMTKQMSWQQYVPNLKMESQDTNRARYTANGAHTAVEIYGRSDLNGDGIEDLLVRTDTLLDEGTYADSRLFLLTRKQPTGVLELIRQLT